LPKTKHFVPLNLWAGNAAAWIVLYPDSNEFLKNWIGSSMSAGTLDT